MTKRVSVKGFRSIILSEMAKKHTKAFRKEAIVKYGWPTNVVNDISLKPIDKEPPGKVGFYYAKKHKEKIFTLEHGDIDLQPTPAMRNYLANNGEDR